MYVLVCIAVEAEAMEEFGFFPVTRTVVYTPSEAKL